MGLTFLPQDQEQPDNATPAATPPANGGGGGGNGGGGSGQRPLWQIFDQIILRS